MQKINEKLLGQYCKLLIDSAKPMINLKLTEKIENNDIKIRSQFAGSPYWPTNRLEFWKKLVQDYGNLSLLVQLNLIEIKDKRLPKSGLLQVFMIGNSYSVFEDDPTDNTNHSIGGSNRYHIVVYHSESSLSNMKNTNVNSLILDDYSAYIIKATPGTSVVNMSNVYDINRMSKNYGISEDDIDEVYDWSDYESMKSIYDEGLRDRSVVELVEKALKLIENDSVTSRVGGYPHFSQDDERSENTEMNELLVQLNSDNKVMFGDMGDLQVFTSTQELKKLSEDEIIKSYFVYQCY